MTAFVRHATLLFLALRAGDLVNLAAGMWFVPKFVASEELGAVLPVTTFATLLVLPVFAFGMTVMKTATDLAGKGERGMLKSLLRGVFLAIGALSALAIATMALLLPHYLKAMRVADSSATFFVFAAALFGSVAPVYTDALQAVKRFRALGTIELIAALSRFGVLALVMPVRAFAGYFAGSAVQPLVRIAASVLVLRRDLAVRAEHWWTRANMHALLVRFVLTAIYLAVPMAVANAEQNLVRCALPNTDSAGYYVVTRLSDILNYLTFPLLVVLFPYAAEAVRNGRSALPLVAKASLATLLGAIALGAVYMIGGRQILALVPNGAEHADRLVHLPTLLAITALTACQTFFTNAEVATGRFSFLRWFVPMNAVCLGVIPLLARNGGTTLGHLLAWFLAGASLRFTCAAVAAISERHPRRILPDEVRGKGSARTTTMEMRL